MTWAMTRWMLAGCTALAALGATAVLDVGTPAAEAAPSVSRFAGSYVGDWAAVTISNNGRITGSITTNGYYFGSISGNVGDDGRYSLTLTEINIIDDGDDPRGGRKRARFTYALDGNMTLDVAGNIVASGGTGGSFVWVRQ